MVTDHFERIPPQNLDAEKGVLGSAALDAGALNEVQIVLAGPGSAAFYGDAHQTIYDAITSLHSRRVGVDPTTLCEELSRLGKLAECGGPAYIASILDSVHHSHHARYYAGIVLEKYRQRQMIYAAVDAMR